MNHSTVHYSTYLIVWGRELKIEGKKFLFLVMVYCRLVVPLFSVCKVVLRIVFLLLHLIMARHDLHVMSSNCRGLNAVKSQYNHSYRNNIFLCGPLAHTSCATVTDYAGHERMACVLNKWEFAIQPVLVTVLYKLLLFYCVCSIYQIGCPFAIHIRCSADCNHLEIANVIGEHNHQCIKVTWCSTIVY